MFLSIDDILWITGEKGGKIFSRNSEQTATGGRTLPGDVRCDQAIVKA